MNLVGLQWQFKVSPLAQNAAGCVVGAVIRFLSVKNYKPIETYRQLCEGYGDNIITEGGAHERGIRSENDRSNVHDEERSERASIVTVEFAKKFRESRQSTVT